MTLRQEDFVREKTKKQTTIQRNLKDVLGKGGKKELIQQRKYFSENSKKRLLCLL